MIRYRGPAEISLRINGEDRRTVVRPADTLLQVLRENFGLTGAKAGCENGDCGACTVMLDGNPVKSCLILAVEAEGSEITTIEGLEGTATQNGFIEGAGFQCGFCTSGFIINSHALLTAHPDPDPATVRDWLESNICRCTGYEGIERAIRAAAEIIRKR